jgi:hypothetical protein
LTGTTLLLLLLIWDGMGDVLAFLPSPDFTYSRSVDACMLNLTFFLFGVGE